MIIERTNCFLLPGWYLDVIVVFGFGFRLLVIEILDRIISVLGDIWLLVKIQAIARLVVRTLHDDVTRVIVEDVRRLLLVDLK